MKIYASSGISLIGEKITAVRIVPKASERAGPYHHRTRKAATAPANTNGEKTANKRATITASRGSPNGISSGLARGVTGRTNPCARSDSYPYVTHAPTPIESVKANPMPANPQARLRSPLVRGTCFGSACSGSVTFLPSDPVADHDQLPRPCYVLPQHHRGITRHDTMSQATKRSILRWIHIIFSDPIIGYVYSPFEEIPNYAPAVRFVFLPALVVTGFWMWKGHVVRRWVSKGSPGAAG
jgi:hypothetical protein